jgi:hypothetical protein
MKISHQLDQLMQMDQGGLEVLELKLENIEKEINFVNEENLME